MPNALYSDGSLPLFEAQTAAHLYASKKTKQFRQFLEATFNVFRFKRIAAPQSHDPAMGSKTQEGRSEGCACHPSRLAWPYSLVSSSSYTSSSFVSPHWTARDCCLSSSLMFRSRMPFISLLGQHSTLLRTLHVSNQTILTRLPSVGLVAYSTPHPRRP